jgi:hypothetical protein
MPQKFGGRAVSISLCGKCERRGKAWWTERVEWVLERRAAERN